MTSEWYCLIDGRTTGPFSVEELLNMAATGGLKPSDRVRRDTTGEWIDAHRLPGMNFANAPPVAVKRDPPRKRDPLGLDFLIAHEPAVNDADDDAVIDVLARGFDSPRVRAERLRVLTGDVEPTERFRTCKVICGRKQTGLQTGPNTQQGETLGDLIFTDSGLLMTNFAVLPKRGEGGHHGLLHLGLIGLIIYWFAESRHMSRGKAEAEMMYYRAIEDWEGADATKIFNRVALANFIPADEMTGVRFRWSGAMEFQHRGFRYVLKPERRPADESQKLPRSEEFEVWRHEAAGRRAVQTGGPPNGGPAALAEWSARTVPEPSVPPWVVAAVKRTEEKWGNRSKEVLDWIPKPYHPNLFLRLADVDAPEAMAWHHRLGKRLRIRGIILLIVGIVLGLVAAGFGVGAMANADQRNDDWIGLAVIGGVIGFIGTILFLWGGGVLMRYRSRHREHD